MHPHSQERKVGVTSVQKSKGLIDLNPPRGAFLGVGERRELRG